MMGDMADMFLDGTLCESCGIILGDGPGYPRRCVECGSDPSWTGAVVNERGKEVVLHEAPVDRHSRITRGRKVKVGTAGKAKA